MKIFHYANLNKWKDIQKGSGKSENKPGLGASRRMGTIDKEAWETVAIFALLEPLPDNWVNNEHFKNIWSWLKSDMGILLLEIEVDPDKDKVFVVDRGHIEGVLYEDKKGIPEKYLHSSKEESESAYMKSKIPLNEYLQGAKELRYSMPEVVILENIPMEKIKISEQQPLIEDELRKGYKGEFLHELLRDIKNIPELCQLYDQYEHGKEIIELKKPAL